MKTILLIFIVLLTACGGASNTEDPQWVQAWDECESIGGEPEVYERRNVITGETTLEVECTVKGVL